MATLSNLFSKVWFKAGVLILLATLTYLVNWNLRQNRVADVLEFCTRQYDNAALSERSGNNYTTYYGNPADCINSMMSIVRSR